MKLATARIEGSTRAVRVDGDTLVDLGHADLGELLVVDALAALCDDIVGKRSAALASYLAGRGTGGVAAPDRTDVPALPAWL